MIYLEFDFKITPIAPARDMLIAELCDQGFESFVEKEDGLLAYILEDQWQDTSLEELFVFQNTTFQITWKVKKIPQQNWNEAWEKNFHPIEINDSCRVRAPFHEAKGLPFEIVIEPKMSFGTGHHETTHMMLQLLLDEKLDNKEVLDMGCGTGVLAILAEMRGAKSVDAIDIDSWCVENSIENASRNHCQKIKVQLGDATSLKHSKYDLIIANINRNILLKDIPTYTNCLNKNGVLLLSGFYSNDLAVISSKCNANNLQFEKNLENNNWVAVKYVH